MREGGGGECGGGVGECEGGGCECVCVGGGGGCECRGGGDCVRAMLSSAPSWVSCSVRWGGGGGGGCSIESGVGRGVCIMCCCLDIGVTTPCVL